MRLTGDSTMSSDRWVIMLGWGLPSVTHKVQSLPTAAFLEKPITELILIENRPLTKQSLLFNYINYNLPAQMFTQPLFQVKHPILFKTRVYTSHVGFSFVDFPGIYFCDLSDEVTPESDKHMVTHLWLMAGDCFHLFTVSGRVSQCLYPHALPRI